KSSVVRANDQLKLFGAELRDSIHPSHVTFTGGADEPGHLWYPYLEGYSPEFVRHTLTQYMPSARRVIDPFAGTGTTPLALGAMGVAAGYCEINPVLRSVVDAKLAVAALPHAKRRSLRKSLAGLATRLADHVSRVAPSNDLTEAYATA